MKAYFLFIVEFDLVEVPKCCVCGCEIPVLNGKGQIMRPSKRKARKTCNSKACRSNLRRQFLGLAPDPFYEEEMT